MTNQVPGSSASVVDVEVGSAGAVVATVKMVSTGAVVTDVVRSPAVADPLKPKKRPRPRATTSTAAGGAPRRGGSGPWQQLAPRAG